MDNLFIVEVIAVDMVSKIGCYWHMQAHMGHGLYISYQHDVIINLFSASYVSRELSGNGKHRKNPKDSDSMGKMDESMSDTTTES